MAKLISTTNDRHHVLYLTCRPFSVGSDAEKSSSNIFKSSHISFHFNSYVFRISPKSQRTFELLLWVNLSPKAFKNRTHFVLPLLRFDSMNYPLSYLQVTSFVSQKSQKVHSPFSDSDKTRALFRLLLLLLGRNSAQSVFFPFIF